MFGLHSRLFTRIMSRNREVYILKIITLAIALASSILIILLSLNEFGFDRFHHNPDKIFRVLKKNTDEQYRGNRLSIQIPTEVFTRFKDNSYKDSLVVSRIKTMNKVTVLSGDNKPFYDQKIHAADPEIVNIFSFEIINGNMEDFRESYKGLAILSSKAAKEYTGTLQAVGKKLKLYTFEDTVEIRIAAVFKDFPKNSHEDFDVFIAFSTEMIKALNFDPKEMGVYGRTLKGNPEHYKFSDNAPAVQTKMEYRFQPLPELYFGPRVLGEDARHGDGYSVIILICIASLILFLSLSSFINLTTITLPYRSKELAIKKVAGTSQVNLLYSFLRESSTLVGVSVFIGLLILITSSGFIESILHLQIMPLIFSVNIRLMMTVGILFIILAISPVLMTIRFVRATPNRLLSADIITFPSLKRIIAFLQLGISIFLITSSVVVRRQINYSLIKEPGQNHDQIVFFNSPAGITNEGVRNLRAGWKQFNPNILDVMAVSQLPDRITSKEIGSEFYLLQVDPGFREFFNLNMQEGYWFGPNSNDSALVTNKIGKEHLGKNQQNVIGIIEDINGAFNQPEKPIKITLGRDYHYNWLCVRVLEVDIRRTVEQISRSLSFRGEIAHVNYLDSHFESWVDYQDRINKLSAILAIISVVLSCFAIYGLSISLVRDKLREIAVHKLFGARTAHITYLLVREFVKQMIIALAVFVPIAYILLTELLRTFVFSTKFMWIDPVYPIVYCVLVIITICGFQALSLNRTDVASALKR